MKIEQDAKYVGDDRWKWSVWIEGTDAELDEIEAVEYTLHPTFPEPVRRVRNRNEKFRLDSAGWGEFQINAHAFRKDGSAEHLTHALRLEPPDQGPASSTDAPEPGQTVFISYAAADAGLGNALQHELAERGVHAITADDMVEPGASWTSSIASAMDAADLVVGIFSDATSPWVTREVSEAMAKNVHVVPIAVGGLTHVPDWLEPTEIVNLSGPGDLQAAVDSLAKSLEG